MPVDYRVLGPIEALVGDARAKLGGPRQRGVLVSLLTRANTLVPASRVIDDLWEDDPPASAANLVQGYVSGLRKALGRDAIETRGTGYLLHVEHDALDLHRFERLAEAGRSPTTGPPRPQTSSPGRSPSGADRRSATWTGSRFTAPSQHASTSSGCWPRSVALKPRSHGVQQRTPSWRSGRWSTPTRSE